VLKVNYRNTAQIVAFAKRFASDVIGAPGTIADDEHAILLPEDAGRQGLVPEVRQCVSIDAEAHCIAEWFLGRKKAGYEGPQMACLYPEHWIGERVAQVLAKHEVPIDMAKNNRNRVATKRVAVRFLSMHTAKGLEFPCVAIAELGFLGRHGEPVEECVRHTYVGVTRATHEALLTSSSESALVQRLIA
jgi:superfamily I DNA/RNA helicase